jgi:hypothetical protein
VKTRSVSAKRPAGTHEIRENVLYKADSQRGTIYTLILSAQGPTISFCQVGPFEPVGRNWFEVERVQVDNEKKCANRKDCDDPEGPPHASFDLLRNRNSKRPTK